MPGQELIGRQLGDYTIIEMLGQGGMAHVYKGYDANLQRYAAVKVIEPDKLPPDEEAEYRERFLREARAIARLSHPRIVGVYQFGQTPDGLYYMAMQFIDGRDLRFVLKEYMRRGKRPGSRHILRIMKDITSALDYAHSQGVIHRDIKPSNIMIAQDGSAILTDFGLVLTASERTLGNAFGSVHYVAPEQAISSDRATGQSDLYSLGIVLYEIMTGRVPFDDASGTSVALMHIQEPPPLPRNLNTDISLTLEDVILKMLDKVPANRYGSGVKFVTALEAALTAADSEDTQELKKLDSKSRPIILPDPELIRTETVPVAPGHAVPVLPMKPLSTTPTGSAQRTRLDPVERQKLQELPTVSDSSHSSQLREQMNAKIRSLSSGRVSAGSSGFSRLNANRGGMGLAVAGLTIALIIGVLTTVLLVSRNANTASDNSLVTTSTAVEVAANTESTDMLILSTEEATTEPSPTRTPRATLRRTPTVEAGDAIIAGAATEDNEVSPTATPTESPTSRPRTTATRWPAEIGNTLSVTPSEEIVLSAESVDASLPSLEMEDGEGQVLLRYDGRSLVLFNRASGFVDVSDLDFVAPTTERGAGDALFNSTDWQNSQIYLLRNANCFQLWSMDYTFLEADEFPADVCDYRQAYQQIDVPFWVGDIGTTFSVERDGLKLGVCPAVPVQNRADNRCVLPLP